MKRLLRDPLLHFLVLGAALVAASRFVDPPDVPRDDEIVVPAGKIEHLAVLFSRTWQRPPTQEELGGLIDDHVREELAYREGVALGLDRDDTIVRRRIRQKLEFFAEDLLDQVEPTEADLEAHLAAQPAAFRLDARLHFRQVYLDPRSRGDALEGDAAELLAALNGAAPPDAQEAGDRTLLGHAHADVTETEVARLFGDDFAAALEPAETGRWFGPIASAYGAHLVRVDRRVEGRLPSLDEVRPAVRRSWEAERRAALKEAFYDELLSRYTVRIEWPDLADDAPDDEESGVE